MLKPALAALALVAFASSASAQAVNCSTEYRNVWSTFVPNGPAAKLTGEQLANTHRTALRAFDACMAGDEQWAKDLFAKIGQQLKKNER